MSEPELVQLDADGWRDFRDVRLASLADSPGAFGSTHADWMDAPEERWRARLTDVPLTILARSDAGAVGVVSGVPERDHVELISMWVAPDDRGTGLAGRLIAAVVGWASAHGRDTFLMVRDDNPRAIAAYERAGFVDLGVPGDWPADEPRERRMRHPVMPDDRSMTTRRGLFVAPFDALADPRLVGDLAASAESAGWDGFFVWDHLQYGDRVGAIADPWICCAAIALSTERLLFGPMVTPLPRRRPQVLAQQASSLAVLSGGRLVLGLGIGDDWVGEFSGFGDESDPKVRGRMLDEGLGVLTALLAGGAIDHAGEHYTARDVRSAPAPAIPVWLAGRWGNPAPMRRAARHDGFFVIGLQGPDDLDALTGALSVHDPAPGFQVVVDLQPDQDVTPWLDRGASWVLTRIGPYDLDLDDVRRIIDAGP